MKTNAIWYHLYVNLKYDTNELIYERDSQIEQSCGYQGGGGWGKNGLGAWEQQMWIGIYRMDKQQGPTV